MSKKKKKRKSKNKKLNNKWMIKRKRKILTQWQEQFTTQIFRKDLLSTV
jgi:hypothetical protein